MAHRYKIKREKERKKNYTRNVSRLVIVNTELTFDIDVVVVGVDDDVLLFPIRLSMVNEFFDF